MGLALQTVPMGSYEDTTMVRIFSALVLAVTASLCLAQVSSLPLTDAPPSRHVVVPGDTLWSLSARFLKEPWRWPELWRMNEAQVRNPNRIYPGDVIVLERAPDGQAYLRLETERLPPQVRASPISQAIPPIPPNVIEPFISSPLVIDAGGLDKSARIVATQQDRVFLGNGDLAYVENADASQSLWHVYRDGRPLTDPENPTQVLGYEAFFLGTARQVRPGAPATFEILSVKQEIGRGDRLVPATSPLLVDYIPHKPDTRVDGRVIAIYGGVGSAGRGSIISFNRGARDGLEIGHVLVLERNRSLIGRDEKDRKVDVSIPRERTGLIFVFRTFARIAYALVLQSEGTVDVNDFVRTP